LIKTLHGIGTACVPVPAPAVWAVFWCRRGGKKKKTGDPAQWKGRVPRPKHNIQFDLRENSRLILDNA
jgi:hypothetical protein